MLDITPRSGLSEEQRLMRQSCRDFVDEVVTPFIRSNWQREWDMNPQARLPPEILQGAEEIGIRTLGVPEEFGGLELDPNSEVRTFALISEEVARGDSGLADKLVQNWKVSVLLRNLAPRHLQEKWFERLIADPQFLLAHCLTEPRGASDRWLPYNVPEAAMQTQAVKNLGVGVHAFEAAAQYAQNYIQGGRVLIKHQAVALRLADMATRIEAVRALLDRAAQAVDDSAPDADTLCNMARLFASEEILKVAQHCLELQGGNGVMLDFGVEKIFGDAAIFLHMDATVDISKFKIVKSMFPTTAGKYAGPES